jgi:hypothetical protein
MAARLEADRTRPVCTPACRSQNSAAQLAPGADETIHFADLFPPRRREAIELLSASLDQVAGETRKQLWAAIRELLNHHRRFAGSDWALSETNLAPLDPIYERLTPEDRTERISWLFTQREPPPPNPPVRDRQAHEEMVAASRQPSKSGTGSAARVLEPKGPMRGGFAC